MPKTILVEMRVWSDPIDMGIVKFSKSEYKGSYNFPVDEFERIVPRELWEDIEYYPDEG